MGARLVRRRILAVAAVVVLVVVFAVSCGGGAGGRADVPVVEGSAGRRGDRRPRRVGPHRRHARGWSPATIDSLDPQRSYSPGVWNLMRLYTRRWSPTRRRPGPTGERVVPDLATDLGTPSDGRPDLDLHAARRR